MTNFNLQETKRKLDQRTGSLELLERQRQDAEKLVVVAQSQFTSSAEALTILREVAQSTQQELESQMSAIVTPAITAITGKDYKFRMSFEQRRNKSECDIFLEDSLGNEYDIMNDNGGGIADIVSIALRIACWRMSSPRTAPIMIMDEPGRNVSECYVSSLSSFLKEVSDRLGIQFIIISHQKALIDSADTIITIGE